MNLTRGEKKNGNGRGTSSITGLPWQAAKFYYKCILEQMLILQ